MFNLRERLARLTASSICLALAGALFLAGPAEAATVTCRDLRTNSSFSLAIIPSMIVPACYDGTHIWQNGNPSGGVDTFGYSLHSIDWVGTYNSGGDWLGAGMNYRVTTGGGGWFSFTCLSRWTFNANGDQTGYDRGC